MPRKPIRHMQPDDSSPFRIRFAFSIMFFGFVVAIVMLRSIDQLTGTHVAIWLIVSASVSVYTAKAGDSGWGRLFSYPKWW